MTISIFLLFERGVFNSHLSFSYKFLWRSPSVYSLKEEFSIRIAPFPINSYDDLHLATLWKRSFQFPSPLFRINSYDDLHLSTLWRGVFNSHFSFSYKFLWRSPSVHSLEEDFSITISPFPTNSYDDLHLSTLWRGVFNSHLPFSYKFLWRSPSVHSLIEEFSIPIAPFPMDSYDDIHLYTLWQRSFQFPAPLFLYIPMKISTCPLFKRGVFNYDLPFSFKFLWRSPSVYSLKEEFSTPISPLNTNSYDDLHLSTLLKRSFQFQSPLFLKIPMTISICLLFERGVFHYDLSFSYKFVWRSPSVYSLKWSFQLGSLLFL